MTKSRLDSVEPGSQPGIRQIGVNLTWLVPGVVGGSEEYSIRLLEGLVACLPDDVRIRLYGRQDLFETYPGLADRYDIVAMPEQPKSKAKRILVEQTWLATVSRNDLVVHHMGGTIPFRTKGHEQKQIVTIHDLQPLEMPSNFHWLKRSWLGQMIPRAAHQADKVVCPSRFTAERIHRLLSVPKAEINVVNHGYEAPQTEIESDAIPFDRRRDAPIQPKLGGQRFLLYPAIAYRHKRHRDLVEAMALITEQEHNFDDQLDDLHLVFTGRRGPESSELDRLISTHGLNNRVHVLGRVPERELDWLYRHAAALVFPSEYEGFGNPCLEAMSRGCPVAVADAGALPEVVGDAALLFPVGELDAIVAAITRIVTDADSVARLVEAGYKQARRFTPSMASEQLWAVYRELLSIAPISADGGILGTGSSDAANTSKDLRRP